MDSACIFLKDPGKTELIPMVEAGYFTTSQAEATSVDRSQLSRYAASGRMQRVRRGIYRLTHFPRTRFEDLFIVAQICPTQIGSLRG